MGVRVRYGGLQGVLVCDLYVGRLLELFGNPSFVVDEGADPVEETLEADGGLSEVRTLAVWTGE